MTGTLMTAVAAIISFTVTAIMGKLLIPLLHKIKFGQPIKDIGPTWHKKKQGTPTMGGFMFIIGITVAAVVSVLIYYYMGARENGSGQSDNALQKVRFWAGLLMSLGCALLGFIDDYIKVIKKNNNGLSSKQKLFFQILLAVGFAFALYVSGDSLLIIPMVGNFDLGVFYMPVAAFIVVATVNAVNLTDGIDGLAGSVTLIYSMFFMVFSAYLIYDSNSILAASVAGGMIGFLLYNFHPAKVFMGDTGSMFLGGLVCTMAFSMGLPVLILPVGIIYFIETLSVLLQTTYFKITHGKRIFKMTPIHHSFEMSGWNEMKIVLVFSTVTFIGGFIAFLWIYF